MIHAPGIYFGMSDTEYHADESFSTSGIKKIITDPEEYWLESFMNPNPPPREKKDCLARGTLWHCRILEPELFDQKYVLAPSIDTDFEAAGKTVLKTVDDLKEWMDDNRVPYKKSGKKADFERMVLDAWKLGIGDTEPYLFDRENAEFLAANTDRTVIWSRDVYNEMLAAEEAMNQHPYFSKIFDGGMAEVSIFWIDEESNIPMKARIDKLKPSVILDYKTLYVSRGKPARKAALDAIKYEHYDVQAAVYTLAVAHAVNMINDGTGVVWGDVSGAFMDKFLEKGEKPFGFVFQKEDAPYTVRGLKVARRSGDLFNVFGAGISFMQQGIQTYMEYMSRFGTEKRWFDPGGMTEILEHEIYYQ